MSTDVIWLSYNLPLCLGESAHREEYVISLAYTFQIKRKRNMSSEKYKQNCCATDLVRNLFVWLVE